jgi:hypothetical protein
MVEAEWFTTSIGGRDDAGSPYSGPRIEHCGTIDLHMKGAEQEQQKVQFRRLLTWNFVLQNPTKVGRGDCV